MITRRMKIRRHLRSARVAALTPEERRDELRATEARCAERHGRSKQAGADPEGAAGHETDDFPPDSHVI
jgi:hypothetical protein